MGGMKLTNIEYLIKNHDKQRLPYEDRGKEYDRLRKREERKKELISLTHDLFYECDRYKSLSLTNYQKSRVLYLVDKFAGNLKKFHAQAGNDAIILAFIFYIKKVELASIKIKHYKIISNKHGLTNDMFEIIVCRLCEYYMKRMPIVPIGTTNYDHEILSENGGKK